MFNFNDFLIGVLVGIFLASFILLLTFKTKNTSLNEKIAKSTTKYKRIDVRLRASERELCQLMAEINRANEIKRRQKNDYNYKD